MAVRELTVHAGPVRAGYRWAAVLAVTLALSSVAAHVWMLTVMPSAPALHVVVLVMAAACLWCGMRLLRAPRVHEWAATAVMGAAMVGLHLMMSGSHDGDHGAMSAMGGDAMPVSHTGTDPMTVSMLLAVTEIAVAVAVLWRLTATPRH